MRVLDIGCGPGTILQYLPRGVEYSGFDINPQYIADARKQYGDRGTFYCQAVSDAAVEQQASYDAVLASGLSHHLNDAEAERLFRVAHAALAPGGYLVTWDPVYVDGQSRLARYLISWDRGQFVRTPEEYLALARPFFPVVESAVFHDLLRIPYTHFVTKCI